MCMAETQSFFDRHISSFAMIYENLSNFFRKPDS